MRNDRLGEKKQIYYKYERNLAIFIISIIIFCVILSVWVTEANSALSYCAEQGYDGSCMNAFVYDGGVVRFIYFAPFLFMSFVALLISGIKAFLARKKLGSNFAKVCKAAKNGSRSIKKKEYYDDTL